MKFPTSNSSLAVGSSSLQGQGDSISTGNTTSPPTTASAASTIVPHVVEPKKSDNDSTQNMAASLTSTAGNFFKRYTSSGHSTNAQEMVNFNTKVVSRYIQVFSHNHIWSKYVSSHDKKEGIICKTMHKVYLNVNMYSI